MPGVRLHRRHEIDVLQRDRLQRGARDVGLGRAARQAGDEPARLGAPVRRAEPGQRRHDGDAARVGHRARQRLDLARACAMMPRPSRSHCTSAPAMNALPSSAYAVARAASVSSVQATVAEQPARRDLRLAADVHQQERAGAEGALGVARLGAVLSEQRRLLVARDAGDRDAVGQPGHALRLGRGAPPTGRPRAAPTAARRTARTARDRNARARRSNSSVRDALVTSVACVLPPDSRQIRKLSTVPNAIAPPRRARAGRRRCRAASGSWSPRSRDPAPAPSARAARARGRPP